MTSNQGRPGRHFATRRRVLLALVLIMAFALYFSSWGVASAAGPVTGIKIEVEGAQGAPGTNLTLQLLFMLTALALIPAALVLVTSFTRIVIVLSLLRHAVGLPMLPPNIVLLSLSLFLTIFVMAPVWQKVNTEALQPYLNNTISQEQALEKGQGPVRAFMFKQTREKDLALFVDMAKIERPQNQNDIPTYVLIPAFAISELKTAFQMGAVIFLPFLIIDIVVAAVLMSMGMLMMPPIMVSLPFKLLLFVLVDGWHLVVASLLNSFSI